MPNINVALDDSEYSLLSQAKRKAELKLKTNVTWAEFFIGLMQESKWAVK